MKIKAENVDAEIYTLYNIQISFFNKLKKILKNPLKGVPAFYCYCSNKLKWK